MGKDRRLSSVVRDTYGVDPRPLLVFRERNITEKVTYMEF